jgi:UPF0176 protein
MDEPKRYEIAAFYKFTRFDGVDRLLPALKQRMLDLDVLGTVLLADEGINGTISGLPGPLAEVLAFIRSEESFADMEHKSSFAHSHVFNRVRVKHKPELISLGAEVDPIHGTGTYVEPHEWNELIADPDVLLIDTRNDYEVHAGTFEGAVDPKIKRFRDLPSYLDGTLDPSKHSKVAMFCTGGIRCEKSTAYLKAKGFDEVFHLKGGILKYLEEVAPEQSAWNGECYVFDERVAVNHELAPSDTFSSCPNCGHVLTTKSRCHPAYRPGRQCAFCADQSAPDTEERSGL